MTNRKGYRFFEDPGHGWLEVPYADLMQAGVADKISGYSYQSLDGQRVFLEEGCDLATFARAIGWQPKQWDQFVSETVYLRVRGLPRYHYQPPAVIRPDAFAALFSEREEERRLAKLPEGVRS